MLCNYTPERVLKNMFEYILMIQILHMLDAQEVIVGWGTLFNPYVSVFPTLLPQCTSDVIFSQDLSMKK